MKLKYYLRGLGIGLILTTLILTISNNMKSSSNAQDSTTTQTTGSVLAYTTQASTESSQTDNSKTTESATESTTATQTTTTQSATQSSSANNSDESAVSSDGTVTVKLENIAYASIATHSLYEAGIIDDEDAFNEYLLETGDMFKIQEGEYSIKPGESYENIAKIITNIK